MKQKIFCTAHIGDQRGKPQVINNNIRLLPLLIIILFSFFLLASCSTELHQEIMGSFDLIKVRNKGVSYLEDKDRAEVGENIGYWIAVSFLKVGAKAHAFNRFRHRENIFGTAGVSINDNFFSDYAPTPEKVKMNGFFSLSGGLDLVNKASKESSQGFSSSVSLVYLQIPVLINYNYPLDESNSIHFGLGPYAAVGLFGHFKDDGVKRKVKFGSSANSDDLKRLDYGLAFNAGFRFSKNWDATLNYDLGLRNVSTTPPDPDTKIRGFSLNIGYWFK